MRQKLDASAERVAAVLRARRAAQDLDPLERRGIDHVEKGVDAAALRAVREAHAVDEDIHFVAGQPAHEDAGHTGARALQVDGGLAFDGLRDHGLRALENLLGPDHIDGLCGGADVSQRSGRGRHGDVFLHRRDFEHQIERGRLPVGDRDDELLLGKRRILRDDEILSVRQIRHTVLAMLIS